MHDLEFLVAEWATAHIADLLLGVCVAGLILSVLVGLWTMGVRFLIER